MHVTITFGCDRCGKQDTYKPEAAPECCGLAMAVVNIASKGGEGNRQRYHLIRLQVTPQVDWKQDGEPDHVVEFWQLRPGRSRGERIGWLGLRPMSVEWRMVPAVAVLGGFYDRPREGNPFALGAQAMLIAIDGGVHAKKRIREVFEDATIGKAEAGVSFQLVS